MSFTAISVVDPQIPVDHPLLSYIPATGPLKFNALSTAFL